MPEFFQAIPEVLFRPPTNPARRRKRGRAGSFCSQILFWKDRNWGLFPRRDVSANRPTTPSTREQGSPKPRLSPTREPIMSHSSPTLLQIATGNAPVLLVRERPKIAQG